MSNVNEAVFTPVKLSPEERQIARDLWDALMTAPSEEELNEARCELQRACPCVQQAVMRAIVRQMLSSGDTYGPLCRNPFGYK